jgi:diguanylate cyclase (GGDEF)-like protein
MISLKKYLDSPLEVPGRTEDSGQQNLFDAAIEAYGSALAEMGNSSVQACPGISNPLQEALESLRVGLSPHMSCADLSTTDAGVCEQLRAWSQATVRHYHQKTCEVKELLLVIARTAESVSTRDLDCAGHLNLVTDRLKTIASLEDLTEIRDSIEQSAKELKTSIERMAEEGKTVISQLQMQVADYQTKLEEAEEMVSRDALTGLSSRLYVENQIETRIEANAPLCVAIIDIDGFKAVNDTYGHLAGDEVLKQFGGELKMACRSTDLIGRWGGDEFILLFDCALAEAEKQLDRIRKWICGNYTIHPRSGEIRLTVSASIGLAALDAGADMKDLLAHADAAMYEQKARSRKLRKGAN